MEYDEKTGNEIKKDIENDIEKDAIASVYDDNGNYYLVGKGRKIFIKNQDGSIVEITDKQQILDVLNLFKPGKTDVIRDEESEK